MVTETGLSLKRTVPFLLGGTLVFIAFLYFFVGIPELLDTLRTVNPLYYGLAVAFLFLNILTSAVAWQYLLRPLAVRVAFRKSLLFSVIGCFVDLLVPAESISGDAARIYLMTKESGENTGKVVASIIGNRIIAMAISLGSLVFSCVALYTIDYSLHPAVFNLILFIIVGIIAGMFFVVLCCLKEALTQRIIDAIVRFACYISRGRLKLDSVRDKATNMVSTFHGSMAVLLKSPQNLVLPAFFAVVAWIFSITLSYLVFVSLGQPVDFVLVTIVFSVSINIQSIPLGVPGEVGLVEIVMTGLYGLLGVEPSIAAGATVLTRLLTVWLRILVGFVAVQWIDLKGLAKSLHQDLFQLS
jgi:uncharacterized protein (TIRG00374 family)